MKCLFPILVTLSLSASALAQPTAFTYQGELKSGGQPVNGLYDLRFKLFNLATSGVVVGTPVCVDNVQVTNGKLTAVLDFGQLPFVTTSARYLEIDVRADAGLDCTDITGFGTLSPRQTITAAPIATHAQSAFALDAPDGNPLNALIADNDGKIGIGTATPTHTLHIRAAMPAIALQDTNSAANQSGYVSYRDNANVERGWVGYGTSGSPHFSVVNARPGGNIELGAASTGQLTVASNNNVGVGTSTPSAKLEVRGDVRLGSVGEFFAVKSPSNDRTLRGVINANGTIDSSRSTGGFTVTHTATGIYTINFTTPFSSPPTIVATTTAQCCAARVNQTLTTSATIFKETYSGATPTDSPFHFIVMGQ